MPLIIAHRGASNLAPQNTVSAFKKAVEIGADGIETDIHLTKDGEIVLCHNYVIDDTSNGTGKIADMTLDELRKFDFGSSFSPEFAGEKLATLDELLEIAKDLDRVIIEIKEQEEENDLIKKAIERVQAFNMQSKVIFSCFSLECLKECQKEDPSIKVALLYDMRSSHFMSITADPVSFCKANKIDALHPIVFLIDENYVKACNENNIEVDYWTVNDSSMSDELDRMGVHGIITDCPEMFIKS